MPEAANVRVICRFRPVNARERTEGDRTAGVDGELQFPDERQVRVVYTSGREPLLFTFDRVFADPRTTQREIYELAARDTIDDVIKGYNGTIFAYGQTGAGKSFTMFGPDISGESELKGIIPRSTQHIFDFIARDREGIEFTIKCSFLEIYKEVIKDLLNPRSNNLKVHETPSRGVWVDELTEQYVTCEQDVLDLLKLGEKFRAVSATSMNAESSRSHSLFILQLTQKSPDGSSKSGKLNLADLAGSEKVGKTGATGETLEEAKKINQSLSALGNCINALTKAKRGHVPYRDSKLTHVLRESLGGNTKTTLLIACSPHKFNLDETVSTLKFGQRAKTIKNSVTVNKQRSIAELNAIIARLTAEIGALHRYTALLEAALLNPAGPVDLAALRAQAALPAAPSSASAAPDEAQEAPDETTEAEESGSVASEVASEDSFGVDAGGPGSAGIGQPGGQQLLRAVSGTGAEALALAETAVELERLRENSAVQIRELQEELRSLTATVEAERADAATLRTKQLADQERIKQAEHELSKRAAQAQAAEQAHQYAVRQLSLQVEALEAEQRAAAERAAQVEAELHSSRQQASHQAAELAMLRLDKGRLEREVAALTEQSSLSASEQASRSASVQQHLEFELQIAQRNLVAKDEQLQAMSEMVDKYRHDVGTMASKVVAQSKDIMHKNQRIHEQDEHAAELTARIAALEHELAEAADARSVLEEWANNQIALQEEAGRLADQLRRGMHIIKPVVIHKGIFQAAPSASKLPKRKELTDIAKEGYLLKESGNRLFSHWQKRYFVMAAGFIYYFESHASDDPRGAISLEGCTVVDASEHTGRKFSLGIYHPKNRTFFLQAQSQAEAQEWIDAIFLQIAQIFEWGMQPGMAPQVVQAPSAPVRRPSVSSSDATPPPGSRMRGVSMTVQDKTGRAAPLIIADKGRSPTVSGARGASVTTPPASMRRLSDLVATKVGSSGQSQAGASRSPASSRGSSRRASAEEGTDSEHTDSLALDVEQSPRRTSDRSSPLPPQ